MGSSRVLILGAGGMLGHKLFLQLSQHTDLTVYATVRNLDNIKLFFPSWLQSQLVHGVDAHYFGSVVSAVHQTKPDLLINCIGIIKQVPAARDYSTSIYINALFPHKVAQLCQSTHTRMLHISTDCVYSGKQGHYREEDPADPIDLYGQTKALGEVVYPHCLTLRTSIIGHEINTRFGLLEWFLAEREKVAGYTRHIYSGLTTNELASFIADHVIPDESLSGLYHLSADPVSKYELLTLIGRIYKKDTVIEPFDTVYCDRSLDSTRLRQATNYTPPPWPNMIESMYRDFSATPYVKFRLGE